MEEGEVPIDQELSSAPSEVCSEGERRFVWKTFLKVFLLCVIAILNALTAIVIAHMNQALQPAPANFTHGIAVGSNFM